MDMLILETMKMEHEFLSLNDQLYITIMENSGNKSNKTSKIKEIFEKMKKKILEIVEKIKSIFRGKDNKENLKDSVDKLPKIQESPETKKLAKEAQDGMKELVDSGKELTKTMKSKDKDKKKKLQEHENKILSIIKKHKGTFAALGAAGITIGAVIGKGFFDTITMSEKDVEDMKRDNDIIESSIDEGLISQVANSASKTHELSGTENRNSVEGLYDPGRSSFSVTSKFKHDEKDPRTGLTYSELYEADAFYDYKKYNSLIMKVYSTIYLWGSKLATKIRSSSSKASEELTRYYKGHRENINKTGMKNFIKLQKSVAAGSASDYRFIRTNEHISSILRAKLSKLHLLPRDVAKVGKYYKDRYIITLAERMDNEILSSIKNTSLAVNAFNFSGFDRLYNSAKNRNDPDNDPFIIKKRESETMDDGCTAKDDKGRTYTTLNGGYVNTLPYGRSNVRRNGDNTKHDNTREEIMNARMLDEMEVTINERFKEVDRLYKEFANYCKSKKYNIQDALKNRPIKTGLTLPPPKD